MEKLEKLSFGEGAAEYASDFVLESLCAEEA